MNQTKWEAIMSRFERAFGEWVVRRRWWIIVATALILAAAGSGTRFLTFSNDMRVFFSEKNPQLKALEAIENTYTKDERVFFAIAPENGDVFTRETLMAIEELTEASWKIPYSSRVDSITNFQHTRAEGDDLIVEDLVQNAESLSNSDLERIKKIALSEPLLVNRQVSPSGHVTGVYVKILLPGESLEEVPEVTASASKLKDNLVQKYPGLSIYLTGSVIMDNAFDEVSRDDMTTLIPVMLLVLLIIIGITLRSFAGTFGTFVIISVSMITGMGIAGWLGISITPASANAPVIILTLAVADSVHILVTMFQRRRLGDNKHEAVSESLRINLQPVFLTSATTAIGFLTMNFSDAPPFRDLGNIVAMGVMGAFLYSVFFLPALMAVLPTRVKQRAGKADCAPCDWLANFVINRRKAVFWGTLAIIAALTAGIARIELNDNWIKYFDDSFEVRRATDFMEENLTGLHQIEYSLESGEVGGINNPEYMATVDRFANWYRTQSKVVHVDTITETMKRLNKNMHGDDESYFRIPGQRDLAAQYLLLYEMSLPFGLDLNNRINVDKSATRMTVTLKDTTTRELRKMDEKARGWLKTNAPERMFTYGSGMSIIWAHISKRNINSMLGASFLALVLISGILIVALRSFKLGSLSLIPNLAPAFMAFGVWGITVGQVGLGLSVIVSMTIGIVVDDTVHFLSKYIRARREHNLDPRGAVRYSFNTVGTAMWVTTVALVSGFIVLAFSGYKMTSDMALMTAITITFALVLDFFFLPTLLMKADMKKEKLTDELEEKAYETVDYDPGSVPDAFPVSVPTGSDSRDS
jgi:predicted RND superfamily exporter protein